MKNSIKELHSNEMEQISGGYIFDASRFYSDIVFAWEVIDDETGNVMAVCATSDMAMQEAAALGLSTRRIGWSEVVELRGGEK